MEIANVRNSLPIGYKSGFLTIIAEEVYLNENYYYKTRCKCGFVGMTNSIKLRDKKAYGCKKCWRQYLYDNRTEIIDINGEYATKWLNIIDLEPKMNQKCVFTTSDKHVFEGVFLYKYDEDLYGFFRGKICSDSFTPTSDVTHWIDINDFFTLLYTKKNPPKNLVSPENNTIDIKPKEFKKKSYTPIIVHEKRSAQSEEFRELAHNIKIGDKFKHWTVTEGPISMCTRKITSIYYKCINTRGDSRTIRARELLAGRLGRE